VRPAIKAASTPPSVGAPATVLWGAVAMLVAGAGVGIWKLVGGTA
jgi:hypothetical protein